MASSHQTDKFQIRFQQAQRFVAPLLQQTGRDLKSMHALEIGCGEGPKSCALAPLFKSYVGIDLDRDGIDKGRGNVRHYGITNAELRLQEANDLPDILATERFQIIILYAVLEHLTIQERLNVLSLCWEALPEDGLLYVGEAPNRISPVDYHSTKTAYFNLLPPELAARLIDKSPHESWRNRVRSEETLELGLYRNGQHVGFEEFDHSVLPLEQLHRHILVDNWCEPLMNLYPLRWFEPRNLTDFDYLATTDLAAHRIPDMFARYWIEAVLSKTPTPQPLKPVSFPKMTGGRGVEPFTGPLGVPILGANHRKNALFTVDATCDSITLGLTNKSHGAFAVYCERTKLGEFAVDDIRAANDGLWSLQSWKTLVLPASIKDRTIRIVPTRGSWIGLCPPFTR